MKKFTLLIALFVCAVGFSQRAQQVNSLGENNPVYAKRQTTPVVSTVQNQTKSNEQANVSSLGVNSPKFGQRLNTNETGTFKAVDANAKKVVGKPITRSAVNESGSATFDASNNTIRSSYPTDLSQAIITLSHNTDNIITDANSVACPGGDNSQARVFVLADFGVTDEYTITEGEIGVQSIDNNMNGTVNVWDISAGFPGGFPGTAVLLGTQAVTIPLGSDLTIVNYTFDTPVVVPAGTVSILVEVVQTADGVSWFIGGTAVETDDSWLNSVTCGLPDYGITGDIGFPDAHYYITVTGDNDDGGGGTICDDPLLEVNQDVQDTCMAFLTQTDIAQSYQPLEVNSAGAGFQFTSPPTSGTDLTLTLWDDLPPNGGTALASGTTVADGAQDWIDVLWDVTAVVPGNTYFIVLTGSVDACVAGSTNDPYAFGDTYANGGFQQFPGFDYTFRTYSCGGGGGGCTEEADFEAGLPTGWSTIMNTGSCDWVNQMETPNGDDFPTLAMVFDDDLCGNGADASNVTLMSDVYDANGATSVMLGYDVAFQESGIQTFAVEVYDGAAWQQVALYEDDLVPNIQTEAIDVTAHANADFQVRWTYDDNGGEWGWHAGVDNFCLTHDGGGGGGPDNDLCDDANAVACDDVVVGDTSTGTDSGGNSAPDLWYSYTGSGSAETITLSLCDGGTDYDSLLRVFDACGGTEIATNDDSCGLQSELDFVSDGTTTYYIMVEGFSSASGNFSLAVTCEPIGGGDECGGTAPSNGFENGKSLTFNLGRIVAHDMDVPADMDMSLETITANVFIGGEGSGVNAAFVDVHIYEDAAGAPGYEIAFEGAIIPTSQTVVGANFGFDVWEVVLGITDVELWGDNGVPTTFWVGLSIEATDGSNVFWENTTTGLVGNGEAYDNGLGGGFIIDPTFEGVYTFEGTCKIMGTNDNTIEGFSYYPNPTSTVINLDAQDNIERVAIYNILGQKVLDQDINATSTQIDVANLTIGTYLMKVFVDGKSATYKVIKN